MFWGTPQLGSSQRMRTVAYLLIFLLLSAQVSDLGTFVRIQESQADQDADGDEDVEYPPTQREQDHLKAVLRNKASRSDLKPFTGYLLSFVSPIETASEASWIAPFRPPILQLFMSLLR
jgi:hypothetical protein